MGDLRGRKTVVVPVGIVPALYREVMARRIDRRPGGFGRYIRDLIRRDLGRRPRRTAP